MDGTRSSAPPTPLAARLAFLGLRWGLALAFFETALAVARNAGDLPNLHLRALEILLPVAVYASAGTLLGLLAAALRPLGRLRALLPPAVALALAAETLLRLRADLRPGDPQFPQTLAALAIGMLLALLLVLPWPWRGTRACRALVAATASAGSLGAVLAILWLAIPRDVERPPVAGAAARASGPNVVLVTWDTVRADVLPLYGGMGLETPNLDALAERSIVFEDMTAVAPITGPTHASILTGVVPPSHGLRAHGHHQIAPEVPTLAELLEAAGYVTSGFVSAFPVKGRFGFSRGFQVFDDRLPFDRTEALLRLGLREFSFLRGLAALRKLAEPALDGTVILERAGNFLAGIQRPFFLWAHFFDAHGPYTPKEPYRSEALARADRAEPEAVEPEAADRMTAYRAEIMELDGYLGELVERLEQHDPGLGNTVVMLVADHGHCFGEGGIVDEHTPSLREATQHIPAVLHLPGDEGAGSHVSATVNQVDILPTLCDLAGVEPPASAQGVDLLPIALDGRPLQRHWFRDGFYMEAVQDYLRGRGELDPEAPPKDRLIMAAQKNRVHVRVPDRDERKKGLRSADWSYVFHFHGQEELFDLHEDPEADVAAANPDQLARMRALLEATEKTLPLARIQEGRTSDVDRQQLEALGYAGDDAQKP